MAAHPVPFIIALLLCLCFTTRCECDGERFCTLNTIMAMKAPLLIIIVVNKRASAMKKNDRR